MNAKPCPACRSSRSRLKRARLFGDSGLYRCRDCHSEFLDPQPTDERLAEIYGSDYYEPWAVGDDPSVEIMKRKTFEPLLDLCEIKPGGALLDVGCAMGTFVGLAAERGARAHGLDLNADAIAAAQRDVTSGEFASGVMADHPFQGTQFDAVTMVDFIEHVRDPELELTLVRERLVPAGRLVLSTPRAGSVVHRVSRRWWPQYREEHLTYFSGRGLNILLSRVGLRPLSITITRKALTLGYAYRQSQAFPVPGVSEITRVGYAAAPFLRQRPIRVPLGEMTIVAVPKS